jgi:hypothetical protein
MQNCGSQGKRGGTDSDDYPFEIEGTFPFHGAVICFELHERLPESFFRNQQTLVNDSGILVMEGYLIFLADPVNHQFQGIFQRYSFSRRPLRRKVVLDSHCSHDLLDSEDQDGDIVIHVFWGGWIRFA